MIISNIELEGFRSFREFEHIDLEGIDCAALVGANHQGKSSIVYAVDWCLFGSLPKMSAKDIISWGEKYARVSMEFTLGNEMYRIERTQPVKSSSKVRFQKLVKGTWVDESLTDGPKSVDPLIIDTIGMDQKVAHATWMMTQNNTGSLCDMEATEARRLLSSAFGLDRFVPLHKSASAQAKEARAKVKVLRDRHDSLREQSGAVILDPELASIADLDDEIHETDKSIARIEVRDEFAADEALSLRTRLQNARTRLSKAQAASESMEAAEGVLEGLQSRIESVRDEVEQLQDSLTSAQAQKAAIVAEGKALATRRDEVARRVDTIVESDSSTCFTCSAPLSEHKRTELLEEQYEAQRTIESDLDDLRSQKAELDERIEAVSASIRTMTASLNSLESQDRNTRAQIARSAAAAESVDEFKAEVDELEEKVASLSEPDPEIASKLTELKTYRRRLVGELSTRSKQAALFDDIDLAQQAVDEAEHELEYIDVLVAAFAPSGIPHMILSGVIAELNTEANEFLAEMDSHLGVVVSLTKDTQKGTTDTVEVRAIIDDTEVGVGALSGQERAYVDLSIRLALLRCIAARRGHMMQTVFKDEGWGALDAASRRGMEKVLLDMSRDFSVFTVTHIEDVAESFPSIIEVDAASGTSRAELVK